MIRSLAATAVFVVVLVAGCEDKSTKGTTPSPQATTSGVKPSDGTADVGPPPRVVTPAGGTGSE